MTSNTELIDTFFNSPSTEFFAGFVAIVGRPNVGKSTLMNHLIGQKISITSDKAQTTRHRVTGIQTQDTHQFIFVDTPGFQTKHKNAFNDALNESVKATLKDVDCVLFVLEAGKISEADREVAALLPEHRPVILVINKADRLRDGLKRAQFLEAASELFTFAQTIFVAAKHQYNLPKLLDAIRPYLPPSPPLYPDDMITDKDSRFLAAEIIREKLFRYLGEELPYSIFVEIDQFKTVSEQKLELYATIYVDKESQKSIVIGNKGERLKKIATAARLDMAQLFEKKIYLAVWVKVKGGWAEDVRFLKQFKID